jgi:ParB family chromosome partitioning protein
MEQRRNPDHHIAGEQKIRTIRIDAIHVSNPRSRNSRVFASIVDNISALGLKRPITVARINASNRFELICGQGRLEAFQALGETLIPAIIVAASEPDRYLMSLVENVARRKHTNLDLLTAVRALEERGYGPAEIARKTAMDPSYISCVLHLVKHGEERLIGAVEKGWLPIALAADIAKASEADVQIAMMQAYESGLLRGEQLLKVRRLVDRRRALGKRYGAWQRRNAEPVTPSKLAKAFQLEVRRQQLVVQRAKVAEQRLLIVVAVLRSMFSDENFTNLLRAENISDIPKPLADRIRGCEQP